MSKVEIIGVPQSTYVRVVRIAAEEKGIAYELNPARPHSPEVLAIHPLGKVPVMRHGAVALFESRAIAGYFDRAFPGPRLIPEDVVAAAETDQWVSLMNCSLHPLFIPYVFAYFFSGLPDRAPDRARIDASLAGVEQALGILDRGVAADGHLACDVRGERCRCRSASLVRQHHHPTRRCCRRASSGVRW